MAQHNELGKWGERLAAEYLYSKGYAIVERNWRAGNIEIDIVAMHNNRLVFVEVKTRQDPYIHPEDAVDKRRVSRMVRAADTYINAKKLPHEVQYDIVAITGNPLNYKIYHIPDAFYAPMRTYR